MRWIIDGNNVFGSRPDGWWNDREKAATRFAQSVAEWCRTHGDEVTIVFDAPVAPETAEVAGGNLAIIESKRRGRNAADDTIVDLAETFAERLDDELTVVTSDKGLRERLPAATRVIGAARFLELVTLGARHVTSHDGDGTDQRH